MIRHASKTIIILHGWGLSGRVYAGLSEIFLKKGYHVFSPDLPGFGNAELPTQPWNTSDYAKFLHDFLSQQDVKNPVIVGHSFGGRIALKYQKLFPNQTFALVLIGTPGYPPVSGVRMIIGLSLTKIGGAFFRLSPFSFAEERVRLLWYSLIGVKDYLRPQKIMRDTFKKVVTESLVESMKAVSCPCLLVWGGGDRIVPLRIAKHMEKTIPGAKLVVIPGARHGVPFKKPDEVAEAIYDFLK